MRSEPIDQCGEPGAEYVAPLTPKRKRLRDSRWGSVLAALAISLLSGDIAAAQGNSPAQLRRFIDQQLVGIEKLMVPSHNSDLPQLRLANGSPDPTFQTTEAKRYLGKLIFHDPARATRIIPEFGGIPRT